MIWRGYTGIAARQIALLHLRAIAFVMFVLLTIAIAIDLTNNLEDVRKAAIETDSSLAILLAKYLGYRAVDIVTRLLPMASLTGAFLAEILRHQRMENVIFAAAGAGPGLLYASLLAVGLALGGVQAGLEGWLRPAAIWAQVDLGLGTYADRFRRGEMGPEWFTDRTRAMRATVLRSDTPELYDIMVFEGIQQDSLSNITYADKAVPGAKPQEWILINVVQWSDEAGTSMQPERFAQKSMTFPLLPAHLEYHRVLGFYLPNAPLRDIAGFRELARWADAETALARRFLAIFLPGVFAYLGASLSQAGRNGRFISWWRLLPLGVVGYVTLVSVKSFWALGEFGVVSPWLAAGAPLVFAFLLASITQLFLNGRLPRPQSRNQACGPRAGGKEC